MYGAALRGTTELTKWAREQEELAARHFGGNLQPVSHFNLHAIRLPITHPSHCGIVFFACFFRVF